MRPWVGCGTGQTLQYRRDWIKTGEGRALPTLTALTGEQSCWETLAFRHQVLNHIPAELHPESSGKRQNMRWGISLLQPSTTRQASLPTERNRMEFSLFLKTKPKINQREELF